MTDRPTDHATRSVTIGLIYVRTGASIPIPSGRSLRPVKNRGGRNFFLKEGLISYFSRNTLKLMPPDALISGQNALGVRVPPRPAVGAHSAPPDPLRWIQWVLLLRGRKGGECAQFCIQIWGDRSTCVRSSVMRPNNARNHNKHVRAGQV